MNSKAVLRSPSEGGFVIFQFETFCSKPTYISEEIKTVISNSSNQNLRMAQVVSIAKKKPWRQRRETESKYFCFLAGIPLVVLMVGHYTPEPRSVRLCTRMKKRPILQTKSIFKSCFLLCLSYTGRLCNISFLSTAIGRIGVKVPVGEQAQEMYLLKRCKI